MIRAGYAIMTDQPTLGLVTGLVGNPPNAFPVNYTPPAGSFVTLEDAFPLANGSVSPLSVAHNYHDAYVSEWNFNIQQRLAKDYALSISYVGSKGTDLNIERNYNQFERRSPLSHSFAQQPHRRRPASHQHQCL